MTLRLKGEVDTKGAQLVLLVQVRRHSHPILTF
jgi:hypothetical protein